MGQTHSTWSNLLRRVLILVLFVVGMGVAAQAQTSTAAGTTIYNRARIAYTEPEGGQAVAVTRTVVVTVLIVNGVSVTPDETASSGFVDSYQSVTTHFSICNTGNNPLPFIVTGQSVTAPAQIQSLYLDSDSSGAVSSGDVPVEIGSTRTPVVAPGACTGVLLVYAANGAQAQTQINASLTARSAPEASGDGVEDRGTIIRTVKDGPILRDPDDPQLPPRKSVNGVVEVTTSANSTVEFEIAFRNVGLGEARGVRVVDELPQGLTFQPNSLKLTVNSQTTALTDQQGDDAGEVTGQIVEVRLPVVAPQEVVSIRFSAHVGSLPAGTVLINRALVSADNGNPLYTRDVRVIVAPQGLVFDGGLGSSSPVSGASLRLVAADPRGPLVGLVPLVGFVPNLDNLNPFSTGTDGLFSFRITNPSATETYYLLIDADGYKSRSIEVSVTPVSYDRYNLHLKAQDGQPLAVAGGYTLTDDAVELNGLVACVMNVPLFSTGDLEIVKTADRRSATIGDVVSYRVEVRNSARQSAYGVEIRDQLPQSFYYVPGSALLQVGGAGEQSIEPEIAGDQLTFRIPTIPGGGTASLVYRVRIGVNARIGEQFNIAVATSGGRTTPPARSGVVVRGGAFSTNQFIVGRVFADRNGNGRFDAGDKAIASARLITQNGFVVLTDAAGNYNIPVIGDGAVVIQLDRSSVPDGFVPHDRLRSDGRTWSRLLATPLQGGAMLQANFALGGANQKSSASDAPTIGGAGRVDGSVSSSDVLDAGPSVQSISVGVPQKKRGGWFKRLVKSIFSRSPATANVVDVKSKKATPAANTDTLGSASSPTSPVPAAAEAANSPAPQLVASSLTNPSEAAIVPVKYSGAPPMTAAVATFATPSIPSIDSGNENSASEPTGVEKVAPGNIELDVEPDSVALKAGFDVPVRVASGWEAHLYLNDALVDPKRVGERRADQGTQTDQLTFVGLDLVPGPNRLRAAAVAPDGKERAMREVVIYGRGPAVSLRIEPERTEIPAGRRSRTLLIVKAFDAWNNPALDGEVALQTSLGAIADSNSPAPEISSSHVVDSSVDASLSQANAPSSVQQQTLLKLSNGKGIVQLVSADLPGTAHIKVANGLTSAQADVRFGVEDIPRMLVGYGNLTIGRNAPVMNLRGVDDRTWRGSMGFFFRGSLFKDHILTLSYDSQRPLQRLDARDRLFQIDPLEYSYRVFGDTSTRYSAAPSNSKVYARIDLGHNYGHSFILFGDYVPEKRDTELAAYNRRITGLQIHFENSQGDYVSFGGAHPDTLFGRDVFPGGQFGFARLSATLILPGSENVWLEVRDRRNPDLLVRREQLVRGVDYNLDADTGQVFFTRVINAFDANLNLLQTVVTYEYRATGAGTLIYHARASKLFRSTGTRLGFSVNVQQQSKLGPFMLGGVDFSQKMPRGGLIHLEWARSTGKAAVAGNYDTNDDNLERQGNAYLATYDQPLGWRTARFQASFRRAGAGFSNPFGATVVAGAQRAGVALDMQATRSARLRVGFTDERNKTRNVDNSRQTIGAQWTQQLNDKLTASLAYDYRRLSETNKETGLSSVTNSQLVTAGIDWKPTDRLSLSIRREQNLGKFDPTYPNQTVLSVFYKLNDTSRLFLTQALRSAPVVPISDLTGGGFGVSQARRELTTGIETKLFRATSLIGGYRLENGVEGSDGYAVIGLGQKWKLNETLAFDANYERAFHLTGKASRGYHTLSTGLTWQPRSNFIANTAYQWRNRDGSIHTLAAGFTGKPFDNVTAIGSFQFSRGSGTNSAGAPPASNSFDSSGSTPIPLAGETGGLRQGVYGSLGLALRPKNSDRVAAFLNYQHRSFAQESGSGASGVLTRERSSTFSADGFVQAFSRVALFGKFALREVDSTRAGLVSSPTLTYLLQGRVEYRIQPRWDLSLESRFLKQPSTQTSRIGVATELGYWISPDVRFSLGYNFNRATEQPGREALGGDRRGFYFSITTKFERVFDFFGARKKAATAEDEK